MRSPAGPPAEILTPDEAFSVLANPTRIQILRTLSDTDDPLGFTELRDRVGLDQGSQFNYHLTKLVGHFVAKTEAGYELRGPGRRVIEAVLSGAMTTDPRIDPTEIEYACHFCGSPIKVSFAQEHVELYCTGCAGLYADSTRASVLDHSLGHLGGQPLPPAGVKGRSIAAVLATASIWGHLEFLALANDVCPRCAAIVEHTVTVCDAHDSTDGLCPACDRRHAAQIRSQCTNCIHEMTGVFANHLLGSLDLRQFVADHGIDPIVDGVRWGWDYAETIRSRDPFDADFTFTIDDDSITLTVDDSLAVVDVTTG